MPSFEQRLVSPTDDQLIQALVKATRAANGRKRTGRLDKDEASWRRTVPRYRRKPSGHMQWRDAVGHDQPEVLAGWWTDRLGRKHWRVQGRRQGHMGVPDPSWPFRQHGLWHVYPERLALRQAGRGEPELIAVCDCGAVGAPEAIAWAGSCCGPCQDRREEGLPPARAAVTFPVVLTGRHTDTVCQMAFAHDGRRLVTGGYDGRVVSWDLGTGEGQVLLRRPRNSFVEALAVAPTGRVLVGPSTGHLMLGDLAPGQEWRPVPGRSDSDLLAPTFSPDGRWLAVFPWDRGVVIDVEAALRSGGKGGLASVSRELCRGDYITAAAFSPDGEAVVVYDEGTLTLIDRQTAAATVLATQGMYGPPRHDPGYYPDDFGDCFCLAWSPDGRWLALSNWLDGLGGLRLYDFKERRWSFLDVPGRPVSSAACAFAADGTLVSCDNDSAVRVWAPERRELLLTVWPSPFPWPGTPVLSPDGGAVAVSDSDVGEDQGRVWAWPWRLLMTD